MDMHKGHLFVKSEGEGHGTTFTLLLPIIHKKSQICSSSKSSVESQTKAFLVENHAIEPLSSKKFEKSECSAYSFNHTYAFTSNDNNIIKSESENDDENSDNILTAKETIDSTSRKITSYIGK